MESDRCGFRERARERPESGERARGLALVEETDSGCHSSLGVGRPSPGGRREDALRGDLPAEPLQRDAVEEPVRDGSPLRAAFERGELRGGREAPDRGRDFGDGNEDRKVAREVRVEQVGCRDGVGGVRFGVDRRLPRGPLSSHAGPELRDPEVQLHGCTLRMETRQLGEARDRLVGPAAERFADSRLERVEAGEPLCGLGPLAGLVQPQTSAKVDRLPVGANAEVERQRRGSRTGLRRCRCRLVRVAARRGGDPGDGGSDHEGQPGDDERDPGAGAHGRTVAVDGAGSGGRPSRDDELPPETCLLTRALHAILLKVMPTYRELLAQVKAEIDEVSPPEVLARLDDLDRPLLLDVREQDEWQEGHLPGAVHISRGNLESRVEALIPDKEREIVVYCAAGARSAFAAKSLAELGYDNVASMSGGFTDWKRNGYAFQTPRALTAEQRARYSRHILIPEVGEKGQQKLLDARVLLIGAGGLGSPSSLYLAAAGVGTLGIVDADVVDDSNLQRQIVHSMNTLGEPKVMSAKQAIEALNPDVEVVTYQERLTSENVERILADGWDVIVDGADNFPTRYLVNDASVWHDIPVVHGSIYRFEGQVTVFHPHVGPCYRCLYPTPPPPELAPSCAEGGVLGVLPGIVGSLQASEALKLIIGAGETLTGRLLLFDALHTTFDEVSVKKDPGCPVCGDSPTITEYVDYVEFCQGPVHA